MRYHGLKLALALALFASTGVIMVSYFTLPQTALISANAASMADALPDRETWAEPVPYERRLAAYVPIRTSVMTATGDILLNRGFPPTLKYENDPLSSYALTRGIIRDADFAFTNLIATFTDSNYPSSSSTKFYSDLRNALLLKDAGLTVVSVANDFFMDFGTEGARETLAELDKAMLLHAGGGMNETDAGLPVFFTRNEKRFAILAYNDGDSAGLTTSAQVKRAGTVFMDTEKMPAAIKNARKYADFVIVSLYSGSTTWTPDLRKRSFAHLAIDSGADLVIGHHQHVAQPLEVYGGKPILYGLGNLIYDQDFPTATRDSLIARVVFGPTSVRRLEFYPIALPKNMGQPKLVTDRILRDGIFSLLGAPLKDIDVMNWVSRAAAPTIERKKALIVVPKLQNCSTQDIDINGDDIMEYVAIGNDGTCDDGRIHVWKMVWKTFYECVGGGWRYVNGAWKYYPCTYQYVSRLVKENVWTSPEGGYMRFDIEKWHDDLNVVHDDLQIVAEKFPPPP